MPESPTKLRIAALLAAVRRGEAGAVDELFGLLRKASDHVMRNAAMDKYSLHRDTHLPGVIEAAFSQSRYRLSKIGIGGDDHGRCTTMLQRTTNTGRQQRAR